MIKYEGIYHFGGRDDRNVASNRMICIKIETSMQTSQGFLAGEPQLSLIQLEPNGIPPPARYMHSMTYYQEKSLITICGGRNDQLSNNILDDLWVLRLEDLEYQRVLIQSNIGMQPRYNHTAAQLGSSLYIFGGMNEKMSLELSV